MTGFRPDYSPALSSWLSSRTPTWVSRLPPQAAATRPEGILGYEDAKQEWENPNDTIPLFTHTETFEILKDPQTLYLFGRRGTGKTALIRMFDWQVKAGRLPLYRSAWVADGGPIITALATALHGTVIEELSPAQQSAALDTIWQWFVHISAMLAVTEESRDSAAEAPALKHIRGYLATILPEEYWNNPRSALRRTFYSLATSLAGMQGSGTSAGLLTAIGAVFSSSAHIRASQALRAVTSKAPCVVFLDSGETYEMRDPLTSSAVASLLSVGWYFATEWAGSGLFVKSAHPSEILDHVFMANRGKMYTRIALITWRYRDLVSFIAKRYRRILDGHIEAAEYDRLSDPDTARVFLYSHLPPRIQTKLNASFDTLAYIVRHTQKTPRQVLILLNGILTFAKQHHVAFTSLPEDTIRTGLHNEMELVVEDSVGMFDGIYPEAKDVLKRVLSSSNCYFPVASLDMMLRRANDIRRQYDVRRLDLRRLLFESGALGVAQAAQPLTERHWLLEALFEYQIKGTLEPPPDGLCVVHPMFHEWLQTRVDTDTFTYPIPYEQEEQEVLASLGLPTLARHPRQPEATANE